MNQTPRRVRIVGGGPAGLMAAIAAARTGASVTVYERQSGFGRKLLASGGGHCNLTNTLDVELFMQRFGRHGRFMADALREFSRDRLLQCMCEWGVAAEAADGFHYFPVSGRAEDVLSALQEQACRAHATLREDSVVSELVISDGNIAGVVVNGKPEAADAVVLATGGAAWQGLGGCSLGYGLAGSVGHAITPPLPALVGLATREAWPHTCAGVTLPSVGLWVDLPRIRKHMVTGILLFTHRGLSGPAILDVSGQVAELLQHHITVPIRLNLAPEISPGEWGRRLSGWRRTRGSKTVRNLLDETQPQSLATALCEACGIDADLRAACMTAAQERLLVEHLTAAPVSIVGADGGMARAMVTRGGIALREIDPARLESRIVAGLHAAGEVLDLDGPCGGYNLQWAFSSGWLAGLAAAQPSVSR